MRLISPFEALVYLAKAVFIALGIVYWLKKAKTQGWQATWIEIKSIWNE